MTLLQTQGRVIPEAAKAAIVAERHRDRSEIQSDYHGHAVIERRVLAYSTHARDIFPELRHAAAMDPDTAHLVDGGIEHREKYSMGAGYYLKATEYGHADGWSVSKYGLTYRTETIRDILEKQFPEAPAPLTKLEALDRIAEALAPEEGEEFTPTRFKVWIHLEALDAEDNAEDLDCVDVGEFDTEEEAQDLADYLIDRAGDCDNDKE